MKTMRYFLITGVLSLLLTGCSTTFRPWNLSKVHEGMERSEVIKVLGDPDSVERKDGAEYLHYSYQEDFNPYTSTEPFDIDSSRAIRDLETGKAFKEYRYAVILVDGKVINYKER